MGLPAWAYGEQVPLSEWEDRGAYLYNRKTGEKRPKGASGGITNLTKPGDLPPEELQKRLDTWTEENRMRAARGERQVGGIRPVNVEVERGVAREAGIDFQDRGDPVALRFREGMEAWRGKADQGLLEDRSNEVTLPHWIDKALMKYGPEDFYGRKRGGPSWLPREVVPYKWTDEYRERQALKPRPEGPPEGWPRGWGETYDPRWRNPDNSIRQDAPEEVHRGIDESAELSELRYEREDLIDDEYEPTRSPLVLRKRNPNGTVTYVHAMTGQPLFDLGEYGLNDPQADDSITDKTYPDPYWRAGRREW